MAARTSASIYIVITANVAVIVVEMFPMQYEDIEFWLDVNM